MLIAMTGQAGRGKDTVAKRIEVVRGELGLPKMERKAFADPLKNSVCAIFGIDRKTLDLLKLDENMYLSWVDQNGVQADEIMDGQMNMRLFLQRYGTEGHRQTFDDDFWVMTTLPEGFDHTGRLVVITDCRFPNEVHRVHELGGYVVEVGDGTPRDELHWEHESEKPLPADLIEHFLVNDRHDDHFMTLDDDTRDMLRLMQTWE